MSITNRDGCRAWPSCFTCPFPDCVQDDDRAARNAELVRLRSDGWTAARLAAHFGITLRHVRRVLAANRQEARPC